VCLCAGIAFCDSLSEILKYIGSSATQDYIVQKYIGSYISYTVFNIEFYCSLFSPEWWDVGVVVWDEVQTCI